jgi:S-adenosylmethionine:tRNA ribosyltransferase-isomerase
MDQGEIQITEFTYALPEEHIARYPLTDRNASRLLSFDGSNTSDRMISDLTELLAVPHRICLNDTRVVHARLLFPHRSGQIEIFCLSAADGRSLEHILHEEGSVEILALVGGARKWKEGSLQTTWTHADGSGTLTAEKGERVNGRFYIRLSWTPSEAFYKVLEQVGHVPLPPYMDRGDELSDRERYQTVFARHRGSVAAPTAGLHLTEGMLEELTRSGHRIDRLTLHVGAGTFQPVSASDARAHRIHGEEICVPRELIASLAERTEPILAVGTTSLRTLESLYWLGLKAAAGEDPISGWAQDDLSRFPAKLDSSAALSALLQWLDEHSMTELRAVTHLYILPDHRFRMVDALLTNFHQPGSTLLLLVAAFIGEQWRSLYQHALENDYRFLSYGDAMLLKRKG